MNTTTAEPDWDQPVKISDHLAATMARMLSRDYPGTTATEVQEQMGKPHGLRDIVGMFARGSLEDAWGNGVLTLDGDTIAAKART